MRHVTLDRDYLIASVRDTTERQKAQEILRASEARLRLVTDNAQVGLVMLDACRNYIFANNTYAKTLGLPLTEIIGRHVPDVVGAIYENQIRSRLDEAFAGRRLTYELHRSLAGREHYYTTTYEPMTTVAGEPVVVAVFTEVTERKEAEAEIQNQLNELQRWHEAVINREERVLELKREVNDLLAARQLPLRYPEVMNL
jgi:PAS domain S-box-containing protein